MDIVARLRMWAAWDYMTESASADLLTAADEIERLREALKLARDELDRRRKNAEEAWKEKE